MPRQKFLPTRQPHAVLHRVASISSPPPPFANNLSTLSFQSTYQRAAKNSPRLPSIPIPLFASSVMGGCWNTIINVLTTPPSPKSWLLQKSRDLDNIHWKAERDCMTRNLPGAGKLHWHWVLLRRTGCLTVKICFVRRRDTQLRSGLRRKTSGCTLILMKGIVIGSLSCSDCRISAWNKQNPGAEYRHKSV